MNLRAAAELAEQWAAQADACRYNRGVISGELEAFDAWLRAVADPDLLYMWVTLRIKASFDGFAHVLRLRSDEEDITSVEPTAVDVKATET